jgi:ribonuclease P protein component
MSTCCGRRWGWTAPAWRRERSTRSGRDATVPVEILRLFSEVPGHIELPGGRWVSNALGLIVGIAADPVGPRYRSDQGVPARIPCCGRRRDGAAATRRQGRASRTAGAPAEGSRPPVGVIRPIQRRATFEMLRQHGRRVRSGPLSALCLGDDALAGLVGSQSPELLVPESSALVAYAIGRPAGGAVARNRCRRRLRAIIRSLDDAGEVPAGAYLIRVSAPALGFEFPDLAQCAAGLFQRVRVS